MLNTYIEELKQYKNFDHNNTEKFHDVLGNIADLKDPKCIKELIYYLDDKSDYQEVLFEIVHLIEEFEDNVYLLELTSTIPWLLKNSPDWAKILHYRILNSSTTLAEYLILIPSLTEEIKTELKKLLILIKKEDKEFAEKCDKLLAEIN